MTDKQLVSYKSLENALDLAATVAACARADLCDIGDLQERIEESLHDLVHMFCYQGRKAIEQSNVGKNINAIANIRPQSKPADALLISGDTTNLVPLSNESFWWIINRIVHSLDFAVLRVKNIQEKSDSVLFTHLDVGGSRVISFRSDRDPEGILHYVDLDALVTCFVQDVAPLLSK